MWRIVDHYIRGQSIGASAGKLGPENLLVKTQGMLRAGGMNANSNRVVGWLANLMELNLGLVDTLPPGD